MMLKAPYQLLENKNDEGNIQLKKHSDHNIIDLH